MAYDPRALVPFIRETAIKYGINPDIAVKVAESEGLQQFSSGIPGEKSFGAFQLNTQGGLGNEFQKATGLDPSDPKNEQAGIDFALRYASKHGWGAFHGAKNRYGYGPFEGIGQQASLPPARPISGPAPLEPQKSLPPQPLNLAQSIPQSPSFAPVQQPAAPPLQVDQLLPMLNAPPQIKRAINLAQAYSKIPVPEGFRGFSYTG